MSFNDPISDFLTRIRNGGMAQHRYVDIPWSKMRQRLAEILRENGFVEHFLVRRENARGTIRVFLRYDNARKSIIQGLKRISKPGLRRYVKHTELKPVFGHLGISIVSTSQGVMTGREAKKKSVGGELLCQIW
jgi:small subunit ribosomal protein S8